MRVIKKIILHCSDSNSMGHNDISIIDRWHKERGFKMVGYHYFIQYNGTVQRGRPLDDDAILEADEIGAHVKGENYESVGICLHGKFKFSNDQFRSLAKLLIKLMEQFTLTIGDIYPHNYFNDKKTCPNFDVLFFIKKFLSDGPGYNSVYKGPKQPIAKKPGRSDSGKSKSDSGKSKSTKPKNRPGTRVESKAKRKPGPASGKTRKT